MTLFEEMLSIDKIGISSIRVMSCIFFARNDMCNDGYPSYVYLFYPSDNFEKQFNIAVEQNIPFLIDFKINGNPRYLSYSRKREMEILVAFKKDNTPYCDLGVYSTDSILDEHNMNLIKTADLLRVV